MASQEQQPRTLQRPDLGIETITQGEALQIDEVDMPWLRSSQEIQTVGIKLEDGTEFYYGSVVDGNHTLTSLAEKVPDEKSKQAEQGLFKAMPVFLNGRDHPNVDNVPGVASEGSFYKIAKRGNDVARLVFTRIERADKIFVVKVGISRHKDQERMMGILKGDSSNRRKRDG